MLKIQNQKANNVDPDETAHYEPSNLDLQCLQIQLLFCSTLKGLTFGKLFLANQLFLPRLEILI